MTTDHAQEEAKRLHLEYLKDCSCFVELIASALRLAEKRGRATIEKELMCELRDPNGTIWEHAKRLQDENDALKSDRRRVLEEVLDAMKKINPNWDGYVWIHDDYYTIIPNNLTRFPLRDLLTRLSPKSQS